MLHGAGALRRAFKAAGIETFNITSDATGGTTFDTCSATRTFDTVLDSALFHGLTALEIAPYVAALAAVTKPGGRLHLICFNEHEVRPGGPRRVTQNDIQAAFHSGWEIEQIKEARYYSLIDRGGALCWIATWRRR